MRLFASLYMDLMTKTLGVHDKPPLHMLDRACEGLQGECHKDIAYVQPKHCYVWATHVQILGTFSISYLVDENLVLLNRKQIPCIFEYVK